MSSENTAGVTNMSGGNTADAADVTDPRGGNAADAADVTGGTWSA
jgi:hypothetical protein